MLCPRNKLSRHNSFESLQNFKLLNKRLNELQAQAQVLIKDFLVSSPSSTNEVNTAYGVSTANTQVSPANTQVSTASTQVSTANLSDDTVYAFLASQPNGSQLVYEDLEQIYEDDLEEMDLKWQLALLSMRTRRNAEDLGTKIAGTGIKTALEGIVHVEETFFQSHGAIEEAGFDWSYMADEEVPTNMALMDFSDSENEVILCEQLAVFKRDISYKDSEISMLKSELKKLKQEKESNQLKIENFNNASKSLDKLIGSQITDKSRKGVWFVSYNVVPPPHTGLFSPPNLDLSYSGLEKFQQPEFEGYGPKPSKSISEDTFNESKQQEKPVRKPVKYAEIYRSQTPRGNQRNWNNQKLTAITIKGKGWYQGIIKQGLSARPVLLSRSRERANSDVRIARAKKKELEACYNQLPARKRAEVAMRDKCPGVLECGASVESRPWRSDTRHHLRGTVQEIDKGSDETPGGGGVGRPKLPGGRVGRPAGGAGGSEGGQAADCCGKCRPSSLQSALSVHCSPSRRCPAIIQTTEPEFKNEEHSPTLNSPRGDGPKWLFDIDVLTKSMNYVPVVAGTNSNGFVCTEESIGPGHSSKETRSSQDYILMPLWKDGSLFDSSSKNASNDKPQPSSDAQKRMMKVINTEPDMFSLGDNATLEATHADFFSDETEVDMSNITTTYPVPSTPNTRIHKDHSLDHVVGDVQSGVLTMRMTKTTNEQGFISAVWTLVDLPYGKRAIGTKWVYMNKKDERGIVVRNKARLVAQGYTEEEGIDYDEMDMKSAFLYGKIEEQVYVCQPSGFEDPEFPDRVYKELSTEFEKLMHKKFQISSMGELTFFLGLLVMQKEDGIFISQDKYVDEILKKFGFSTVRIASTPMETSKPLLKDAEAEDVDVYLYRSMIGSLMYLTALGLI
ncbi:retrovirus-related pol polyprotein from transposon TNT 1-94 [Tanacetum coccineum]|uniref:Retrovirus-related pol polyprotein from transposon TNT 1-94 n=1 Tax=Tanacetum coccineum TaxID=301880 RepID=A0ABQ5CN49_9ASTR